jgi:plasmid replication initiation protein
MSDAAPFQADLFALDSPLLTEVRGEQSLMAFPFFALSKGRWTKPLAYKTDAVSIEIVATSKGIATIYDKEVLLYIASLMVAKLDAGFQVSQDFYFTAHDLFRAICPRRVSMSRSRAASAALARASDASSAAIRAAASAGETSASDTRFP